MTYFRWPPWFAGLLAEPPPPSKAFLPIKAFRLTSAGQPMAGIIGSGNMGTGLGKMRGIVVFVVGNKESFLPVGPIGTPLAFQFMDAQAFAVWWRSTQIPLLNRDEWAKAGAALPNVVKGHTHTHGATC